MPRTREQAALAAWEKALMRAINRCRFELDLNSNLKMSEFLHTPYGIAEILTDLCAARLSFL